LRNDRYVGYLFSAGGGMALSRAGLNSLGVVANYFKKNPVYALNAINDTPIQTISAIFSKNKIES